jgi:hypothetical protein
MRPFLSKQRYNTTETLPFIDAIAWSCRGRIASFIVRKSKKKKKKSNVSLTPTLSGPWTSY